MCKFTHFIVAFLSATCVLLMSGCSSTRHVPQGSYLLDKVKINIEGDKEVTGDELDNYLKQSPNHKVLGFWKLQLPESEYFMVGALFEIVVKFISCDLLVSLDVDFHFVEQVGTLGDMTRRTASRH